MWPMRATIGRPALRCVCKRRRASMIDRRHFLIGAGALLTASFVRRASAFSKKTGGLLIFPAVQEPEETLNVYWQAENEVANWRVSLGPDQPFAPPPPTWREHLRSLGHPLETDDEIERACRKYDLPVDDLDTRLKSHRAEPADRCRDRNARLRGPLWRLCSRCVGIARARRLRWLSAAVARHEISAQSGSRVWEA